MNYKVHHSKMQSIRLPAMKSFIKEKFLGRTFVAEISLPTRSGKQTRDCGVVFYDEETKEYSAVYCYADANLAEAAGLPKGCPCVTVRLPGWSPVVDAILTETPNGEGAVSYSRFADDSVVSPNGEATISGGRDSTTVDGKFLEIVKLNLLEKTFVNGNGETVKCVR